MAFSAYRIVLPTSMDNDYRTYETLFDIHVTMCSVTNKHIIFDMKNTRFIAANLFSVLGCILNYSFKNNGHTFSFDNVKPDLDNIMRRNGFARHFNIPRIPDPNNTVIEYWIFDADTENLEQFEKYTFMNIFERKDMPNMSPAVKHSMVDNMLEIFNNVIDHGHTDRVFVSGQYFVKKEQLVVTITDMGNTIKQNVTAYATEHLQEIPNPTLLWAIIEGNSTKTTSAPGGLGISRLLQFLRLNEGSFTLISEDEYLQVTKKGKTFKSLEVPFPGTIVSIAFNMSDRGSYRLKNETDSQILL